MKRAFTFVPAAVLIAAWVLWPLRMSIAGLVIAGAIRETWQTLFG